MQQTPPVLFLIFNRPDLTEISFEQIRKAKPAQFFVAADGARADRDGEEQLCKQARRIIERVDWPCDLKTLFRAQNLGCRRAISEAISWFFEHVEEGIILEDDCVPNESFFRFCAELLERYRNNDEVMCITGDNFQDGNTRGDRSYYFSVYFHCWGWASWRRAWAHYDAEMSRWNACREHKLLFKIFSDSTALHWQKAFESVANGQIDTWDYIWSFTCFTRHGLTATPNVNLVSNIGFAPGASHTFDSSSKFANMPRKELEFPLIHPLSIERNTVADEYVEQYHYGIKMNPTRNIDKFRNALSRVAQRFDIFNFGQVRHRAK